MFAAFAAAPFTLFRTMNIDTSHSPAVTKITSGLLEKVYKILTDKNYHMPEGGRRQFSAYGFICDWRSASSFSV